MHRVLERDEHRQDERHDEDDLLDVAGPPHRLEVIRLDGAEADEHEQAGEGGHGDVADHLPEGDDHDRHHEARDQERLPRAGARDLVDRRRRDRPADGHPLEDPGGHVGRALPHEVARHVAVGPVRVGEVGGDARALDQADEGEGRRGHDQRGNEAEQRRLRPRQRAGDDAEVVERGDLPAEEQRAGRGDHHRHHEAQGPDPRPLEQQDEGDGGDPDREGLGVELTRVEQRVDRPDDAVPTLRVVAGEVGELAQDDVHADRVDEPHHHRVGHEPQEPRRASGARPRA